MGLFVLVFYTEETKFNVGKAIVYGLLFVITILVVLGVIPWWIATIIVILTMCILDIYVLSVDWNVWSLIGAILCGISAIMSLVSLIRKIVHRKKFYGRWVL